MQTQNHVLTMKEEVTGRVAYYVVKLDGEFLTSAMSPQFAMVQAERLLRKRFPEGTTVTIKKG